VALLASNTDQVNLGAKSFLTEAVTGLKHHFVPKVQPKPRKGALIFLEVTFTKPA
jgi:hypothetical protein